MQGKGLISEGVNLSWMMKSIRKVIEYSWFALLRMKGFEVNQDPMQS